MTIQETAEMFSDFLDYYPEMVVSEKIVRSWQKMLTRVKKQDMDKYVHRYVSENKWPPHVSDLKQMWQADPSADPCDDKEGE